MTLYGDIIIRGSSHVVMVANRDVLFDRTRPTHRDNSWIIQGQIDSIFCPEQQKFDSLSAPSVFRQIFCQIWTIIRKFWSKLRKIMKKYSQY